MSRLGYLGTSLSSLERRARLFLDDLEDLLELLDLIVLGEDHLFARLGHRRLDENKKREESRRDHRKEWHLVGGTRMQTARLQGPATPSGILRQRARDRVGVRVRA